MNRGKQAEAIASRFLKEKGLTVLETNYRCRAGEIDLVLRDGDSIVFTEVRLRTNPDFGGAAASIDAAKRRRIVAAARHWLAGKPPPACRFDVVLLESLDPPAIEWIRDAFSA